MSKKPIFMVEKENIPEMPIKNWIMTILNDKGERRSRDAVSLTYEVFIFVNEILPSLEPEFEFKCTCCGPTSDKIALGVKQLLSTKMLEIRKDDSKASTGYGYHLTEGGAKKAEKLLFKFPKTLRDEFEFMNSVTDKMGITGMAQYIYSVYPEYICDFEGGKEIA